MAVFIQERAVGLGKNMQQEEAKGVGEEQRSGRNTRLKRTCSNQKNAVFQLA
ncbi:MAG: hypothetical protein P1P84_09890 [Deferrisomatales bacterium]|nr:hypothetical protein [Deferrisomatales bacterium]